MSWKHIAVSALIAVVAVAIAVQIPGLREFYRVAPKTTA